MKEGKDNQVQQDTQGKPVVTGKIKIIDILKNAKGINDNDINDENIYDYVGNFLDELLEYKNKVSEAQSALSEYLSGDPLVAAIISDLFSGAPVKEAVLKHLSPEDLKGDIDESKWAQIQAERLERGQRIEANKKAVNELIDSYKKENNLSDEDIGKILNAIDDFIVRALEFAITKEDLDNFKKIALGENTVSEQQTTPIEEGDKVEVPEKNITISDGLPDIANSKSAKPTKEPSYVDWLLKKV